MLPERLGQFKKSTSSGLESATFRLVAQCLNHYATVCPKTKCSTLHNGPFNRHLALWGWSPSDKILIQLEYHEDMLKVFTAGTTKSTIFWDLTPHSLVEAHALLAASLVVTSIKLRTVTSQKTALFMIATLRSKVILTYV
jgi:hypothetical protein